MAKFIFVVMVIGAIWTGERAIGTPHGEPVWPQRIAPRPMVPLDPPDDRWDTDVSDTDVEWVPVTDPYYPTIGARGIEDTADTAGIE